MLYFLICVNVCELTKYLSVGKRKRIILLTRAIGFRNSYKQIFRMTLTSSLILVIPLQLCTRSSLAKSSLFSMLIWCKQNKSYPLLVAGNQNITSKSMFKPSLCYRMSWSVCHVICINVNEYTHTCILLESVSGATLTQTMKARCII